MALQRYNMETEGGPYYPVVESDGEWIRYEDHEARVKDLEEENQKLRDMLDKYSMRKGWRYDKDLQKGGD